MSKGLSIANLRLNVAATGNDIVDEVTLTVEPGRVLGLVGESGSGKTTVGLAVLGHARRGVAIDHGSVSCGGIEVLTLDDGGLEAQLLHHREALAKPDGARGSERACLACRLAGLSPFAQFALSS